MPQVQGKGINRFVSGAYTWNGQSTWNLIRPDIMNHYIIIGVSSVIMTGIAVYLCYLAMNKAKSSVVFVIFITTIAVVLAGVQVLIVGGPELIKAVFTSEPDVRLRSYSATLSEDDVKAMLKKYNFYDKDRNKSGDFKNEFTDNRDGTVTDSVTGLMWKKAGSFDMIYNDVDDYIDGLNQKKFAGYDDWRFSTLEELASLLESKKVNDQYIDPVFDRKWRCWTADMNPPLSPSWGVWIVYFNRGDVYLEKNFIYDILCVRAVRSRTM